MQEWAGGGGGVAVMGECYDSYLGEGDKFDMSGMPQREREEILHTTMNRGGRIDTHSKHTPRQRQTGTDKRQTTFETPPDGDLDSTL